MVTMLRVEWIPSGSSEPLTSFSDISFSGGPSQTFKMSWDASVSKARNWRLKNKNMTDYYLVLTCWFTHINYVQHRKCTHIYLMNKSSVYVKCCFSNTTKIQPRRKMERIEYFIINQVLSKLEIWEYSLSPILSRDCLKQFFLRENVWLF